MKKVNKKILITGGAGYIGQNLITFFLKEKYKIFVIDNLSTSKAIKKNIKKHINFFKINLSKEQKVKEFFKKRTFDLIVHLAAFSGLQEFKNSELKSLYNNVLSTKNLVQFGFKNKKTKLIFASSAAVYGKVSRKKINEKANCVPVNYYGLSKYICEKIIKNQLNNKKVSYAILRYFNVIGSLLNFKTEEKIKSLFDIVGNNIKKKRYKININGKRLDTRDGTPERDFIHIQDLCEVHKKIYKYLKNNKKIILNCGSGKRYSVLKFVNNFEKKIGRKFKISYKITNTNETETICSDTNKLKMLTKIRIKKNNLNEYIEDYL